jgi:hypothetical protein
MSSDGWVSNSMATDTRLRCPPERLPTRVCRCGVNSSTQYLDSDGNVVKEDEIDWDSADDADAEPHEGLRHADCVRERPERIGHANVGFFLQTYAHVLRNDDRDAAEQVAAFLIGNGWDPADEGDS